MFKMRLNTSIKQDSSRYALGFLYRKASIGHFLLIKLSIFCHFLIELKSYFVERAESAVATDTTEMG